MYTTIKKFTGILFGVLFILLTACDDDIDPVITDLTVSRAFAPVGLEARVRNQIDIELSWTADARVNQYVIEFFQDSLEFSGDPVATGVIEEVDIPVSGEITFTETLNGDTRYSARVKAVVDGIEESNWAEITARTSPEQLFFPLPGPNVQDTYAKLLWEANSEVTHFLVTPGNLLVQISNTEKLNGEATLEGLSGATDYTVSIYNGSDKRGTVEFSTLKEYNVTPLDDLAAKIDAAAEGDTLILAEGMYDIGSYILAKSIVIEGQKSYDKPVITGQFQVETTIASIGLVLLDMRGENNYNQVFNVTAATGNPVKLVFDRCEISGYKNNILYNQGSGTYGDVIMINSYVYDIDGGGGDGFDIRGGAFGSLTVENCTFSNGIRSFLRMQVIADVKFKNCTFYKVCTVDNSNNRGFFRMSAAGNSLEVSNCLFVDTGFESATNGNLGNWTKSGDVAPEVSTTFKNNFYYNAFALFEGQYLAVDVDATEANPAFVDASSGDFTVTNQDIIDANVGDTKWLQ
ncbi:DUF5123 domain-containing protein [Marinoscillum sp. MHG1-6]|uniref:DUF5123 domain-containing protein n=1 Tax=Marinoscillum sp. MHG1-6 TaxID=2959627 RepID=UPI0021577C66|nr:DUF5123 domain-containing protein [Marinoscillum sp. MHG1-6]